MGEQAAELKKQGKRLRKTGERNSDKDGKVYAELLPLGRYLQEVLDRYGLTQNDLAEYLADLPGKNNSLKGKQSRISKIKKARYWFQGRTFRDLAEAIYEATDHREPVTATYLLELTLPSPLYPLGSISAASSAEEIEGVNPYEFDPNSDNLKASVEAFEVNGSMCALALRNEILTVVAERGWTNQPNWLNLFCSYSDFWTPARVGFLQQVLDGTAELKMPDNQHFVGNVAYTLAEITGDADRFLMGSLMIRIVENSRDGCTIAAE